MSTSEIFNIENMKWLDESSAPVPIFDFNDLINNSNNILVEFKKAIINDKFIYLKNHV